MDQEERLYKAAQKRVEDKKGFYTHLAVYFSVGAFFLFMNILNWEGEWWFFFPLLPWGIAISIHYLSVFGFPINKILSADWEEQELQKEMKRLKKGTKKEVEELKLKDLKKDPVKRWDEEDLV